MLQLYPVTGDLGEAQDVVQEAFVKLLASPGRVSGLANPEAWLRTVAGRPARRTHPVARGEHEPCLSYATGTTAGRSPTGSSSHRSPSWPTGPGARVHRNRTARLAGVAVLAALVAVPLLTLQGGGGTPPARFPDVQFPPELANAIGLGMAVEFYDTRHGYATFSGETCNQAWVSATRDGGWYGFIAEGEEDENGALKYGYLSDDGLTWQPVWIPSP